MCIVFQEFKYIVKIFNLIVQTFLQLFSPRKIAKRDSIKIYIYINIYLKYCRFFSSNQLRKTTDYWPKTLIYNIHMYI